MSPPTHPTVLVTGASGRTGAEILDRLTDAPYRVRALTRSPERRPGLERAGADEVVVGDLLAPEDARRAVEGCDDVLFAAGSRLATGLLRPWKVVDGRGVETLVEAAEAAGVRRVVLVSTIGVGTSRRGMPRWARWFALRWSLRGKSRAERALRESSLEHVILRPGWLTDESATGDVLVCEGAERTTGSIPRADVARLAVDALSTPQATNRTVEILARADAERLEPETEVAISWTDPTAANSSRDGPSSDAA